MLKLENLLFKGTKDFEVEQIDKVPFSIHSLIQEQKTAQVNQLNQQIDRNLLDPNAKKCSQFRQGNLNKKQKREEELQRLKNWDGMERKDLTEEQKQDLQILELRKTLMPNQGYKRADKINHGYIQWGTVIGDKLEGNKGFLKRKDKKQKIIEQFLQQDEILGKSKQQYREIQEEKMKHSKNKKWIKLKRLNQYKTTLKEGKKVFDFDSK